MAKTQAQPSQAEQDAGTIPAGGSTSTAVSQPIGVPYYIIDPSTGQPAVGPDNRPLRWGAQVPVAHDTNMLNAQGGMVHAGGQAGYQLPRYFDGDQWLPAQLPPDQLASLQRKMVAAGLMKTGEAQLGVWDQASMTAYTRLLGFANAAGLDVGGALDRWSQQHSLDPNAGRAPLVKQVSSLEDLRPVIRKAFIDTLGVGISQQQIDHLATQFQSMQAGAQEQAYSAQDAGGTVTQPPSMQAYAEAQARTENPVGAQEHDIIKPGGPLDAFRQMIAGWQ